MSPHTPSNSSAILETSSSSTYATTWSNMSTNSMDNDAEDGEPSLSCDWGFISTSSDSLIYWVLDAFHDHYGEVHAPLCIVVSIVGLLTNGATIVVLSRRHMRNAINLLLLAIAICDVSVMLSNLVFVMHFSLPTVSCPADYSHTWALFMYAHACVTVVAHSSSVWLTVALATTRVLSVKWAGRARLDCVDERGTLIMTGLIVAIMFIANVPSMNSFQIVKTESVQVIPVGYRTNEYFIIPFVSGCIEEAVVVQHLDSFANRTIDMCSAQMVNCSAASNANHLCCTPLTTSVQRFARREYGIISVVQPVVGNCITQSMIYWFNGIFLKIIPCILLTVFICLLLRILHRVRQRRRALGMTKSAKRQMHITININEPTSNVMSANQNVHSTLMTANSELTIAQLRKPSTATNNSKSSKSNSGERTTQMLTIVLLVFLITELPQGILSMLTGIFDDHFRRGVYSNLGDFMDMLSLVNSAVNFIIYCSMSTKFRAVFSETFGIALIIATIRRYRDTTVETAQNMGRRLSTFVSPQVSLNSTPMSIPVGHRQHNNRLAAGSGTPPSPAPTNMRRASAMVVEDDYTKFLRTSGVKTKMLKNNNTRRHSTLEQSMRERNKKLSVPLKKI